MAELDGDGAGSTPPPPARAGSFALGAVLDRDGEALVVAATGLDDTPFAGRPAIAVLAPTGEVGADDPSVADQTVATLSELDHPNLAPVFEVGSADGWAHVCQTPTPEPTLQGRVERDGPLPAPAVVELVEAVAAGLGALHARGIAHGRVRPATIGTVDGPGYVLGGLAPFARRGPVPFAPLPYLAPEAPASGPSPAADQYALAATAAFALSGRAPAGRPDELGLAAPLAEALARGMAPEPEARFPDVAAFAAALAGAVQAAADATVGGAWEAMERRDYAMAAMLVEVARGLSPGHRELPALGARLTVEGHPPEAAGDDQGTGQLSATGLPPGFEFLAPPPAPPVGKRTSSNPWLLVAVVGFLGLVALVVLAALLVAIQG